MNFSKLLLFFLAVVLTINCSGNAINDTNNGDKPPITDPEAKFASLEAQRKPFLKSELSVITPVNQTMPDEASRDYVEIYDQDDSGYRTVTIVGKKIVIEDGHENGIYTYNNDATIDEINFNAETILVKQSFRLKGGDINIKARNLVFEGTAQFITTPDENLAMPNQLEDGLEGAAAGNMAIDVENLDVTDNQVRFVLQGAKGQQAGFGQDGSAGKDITGYNYTVREGGSVLTGGGWRRRFIGTMPTFSCTNNTFNNSKSVVYVKLLNSNRGYDLWPSNGGDAKPGGKPGKGGLGGSLSINRSIDYGLYDVSFGDVGEKAPDCTGGRSGYPEVCIHASVTIIDEGQYGSTQWGDYSYSEKKRTYTKGADATSPDADPNTNADNGTFTNTGKKYSWIEPGALQMSLAYAKDLYMKGFITETEVLANDYIAIISNYQEDSEWNDLVAEECTDKYIDEKLELESIKEEFEGLLQRIAVGKDYFGNPVGWVPRLSFEVNMKIYEEEVDRSFNIMKFAYILNGAYSSIEERDNALRNQKINIQAEVENAVSDLNAASEEIPSLQVDVENLNCELEVLQDKTKILEDRLLAQAKNSLKKSFWRKAARFVGTVAAVCPVGQPTVGRVGTVVDIINAQSSGSDFLEWDTIKALGMATKDVKKDWKTDLDELTNFFSDDIGSNIDDIFSSDTTIKEKYTASKGIKAAYKTVFAGYKKYKEEREARSVGLDSELQAKWAKLKAESPEFQEFIKREEALMEELTVLAEKIDAAVYTIEKSNAVISKGMLAINYIDADLQNNAKVLDKHTLMYINEMDRMARERLLLYHYYMAKAYEYRLMKSYSYELNINSLFDKLVLIQYGADPDFKLEADHFDELKAVYKDQVISDIINDIYTKLLNNESENYGKVSFNIGSDDLARLNKGKDLKINLKDLGLFRPDEENLRIENIRISEIVTENSTTLGSFGDIKISFKHSGESFVEYEGQNLLFRHYNNQTRNSIEWATTYDPYTKELTDLKPAFAAQSLVASVIGADNLMMFSRPSAWADLTISKSVNAENSGADIIIKSARIEVEYNYTPKSEKIYELSIMPSDNGIMPEILIDKADKHDRTKGSGYFIRAYDKSNAGTITITAPENYGEWTFEKWTDAEDNELTNILSTATNIELKINLNKNTSVKAHYKTENELILNKDDSMEDIATEDLSIDDMY